MENKQVTRKNNDIKTQKPIIVLGDSTVKHINGWEISKLLQGHYKGSINLSEKGESVKTKLETAEVLAK